MKSGNLHKASPGALVLQNGRQAGARRSLGVPATFIGRNPGTDVRLNVEGVDPLHCLLVSGPDGLQLRDLNSVHGTFVNGVRADNILLQHGDLLKVGPFQFRIELTPVAAINEPEPAAEELRESLRIQAAAVAAQQAALEEEEARLLQRRSDLQQQEEQLADHLAEKQRQVELWTEYTKAERETLRKEKLEHERRMDKVEAELAQARQNLAKDHHKLTQERQRIVEVYKRLRQRWQKQWSAEREKYARLTKKAHAEALALEERERALATRETAHSQDVRRFNTEHELGVRQLREDREALKKDQERWRRRRAQEVLVLKGMQRRTDEAQIKLKQARLLLLDEKRAWEQQLASLQGELSSVNDRVVNQHLRIQKQAAEIARLDTVLRERQLQVTEAPTDVTAEKADPIAPLPEPDAPVEAASPLDGLERREALERVASELGDQRLHLLEQYERLAQIQDAWQRRRDHAAAELESLAQRLLGDEQALVERAKHADAVEASLHQRQQEIDTVRQELQIWRAQLRAREQTFEKEHESQRRMLGEKEALMQEQLDGLAQLRQRWNQRRQQELEQAQSARTSLENEKKQTQEQRVALFGKRQAMEEEKRILAEKALALEQYRQEVFFRSKDPAAQRRVERLRRRWLALNAAVIRNSKSEAESVRKELQQLETRRAELHKTMIQMARTEATLAEKQDSLEEREVVLKSRLQRLDQDLGHLKQHQSDGSHLRLQEDVDNLAQAVYAEPNFGAIDKAA